MPSKIKVRETIFGFQYTIEAGKDRYPVTMQFRDGCSPLAVWERTLTLVTDPERFGPFETAAERRAWMRAFIANWGE